MESSTTYQQGQNKQPSTDRRTIIRATRLRVSEHNGAMWKPCDAKDQIFVYPKDYFTEDELVDLEKWSDGDVTTTDLARNVRSLLDIQFLNRNATNNNTRSLKYANSFNV
jgi:hypothetical protein